MNLVDWRDGHPKNDDEWRAKLTPEQFQVLRKHGTERAGTSPLNKEHRAGIFRCAGCGQELFTSDTKFESGTGWPSFWAPLENAVETTTDRTLRNGANRGALRALQRAPGPCVRGRPPSDRAPVLYEWGFARFRAEIALQKPFLSTGTRAPAGAV